MCWSGEASLTLASIGLAATGYAAWRGESPRLYGALGYFSLMELLQGYSYSVIDQCGLPANQVATLLGYLHIAFQPFFINMISMYFIPDRIRLRIEYPVYALCFMSAIFMLFQLYPFAWAGSCYPGSILCSDVLCTVRGSWHIAWEIPLNGLTAPIREEPTLRVMLTVFPSYVIAGFYLPLLYGSWRFTLYHLFSGPLLAHMVSGSPNEMPAVWCLLSIAILLLVVKTPLRNVMFVKNWLLWPAERPVGSRASGTG